MFDDIVLYIGYVEHIVFSYIRSPTLRESLISLPGKIGPIQLKSTALRQSVKTTQVTFT